MLANKLGKFYPVLLLISPVAIAQEYFVEQGDTLSEIAQKLYPDKRIYGKHGTLAALAKKNSQIKNIDYIYPRQVVKVEGSTEQVVVVPKMQQAPEPELKPVVEHTEETPSLKFYDHFTLGIGFGPRFYSQEQTGSLGKTDGQTIFWKNIDFFAGYSRDEFEAVVEFSSYQMDFDSDGGGKDKQLYRLNPKVYYKNFFFSALYEEQPLFQYMGGVAKMSKEAVFLPGLGYRWVKVLNSHLETRLEVEGEINYLVSSDSDKQQVKIKSVSGYGARVGGKLVRRLNTKMPLYYYWANNFRLRSFERDVSWGTSSGKVKSTHLDFSSVIGLSVNF